MHTPPGSPPESRSRDRAILALIVLGGAWLRFAALGNGLPAFPQVDEQEIVDRALRMMQTGSLNPAPFFDYPTLYIYLQAMTAVVRFVWGAMNGLWATLDQLPKSDFYWEFYVWGRAVTATLGTATIIVTYAIGRRLGAMTGLIAAVIIATQPLHVRESHYVLTDVPMTFFVTLGILLSIRAFERGTVRDYLLAGVAAGLAAGTKYNGGVVIILPLVALLVSGQQPKSASAFVAILAGAAGAFLAVAPYTILDLPAFLNAFGRLAQMYARDVAKVEPAWLTYLKHLRISMGWRPENAVLFWLPLLVPAAAAVYAVGAIVTRRNTAQLVWASCLLFTTMWFTFIAGQNLIYARYLLPLLPPLAVMIAGLLAAIAARLPLHGVRAVPRWVIVTLVVAVVLVPPMRASVRFVEDISKVRTTDLAYEWIMQNIKAGSHIVLESRQILLPGDHFVSSNEGQLVMRSFEEYAAQDVEYLVASSQSFGPYVGSAAGAASPTGVAYRELFRRLQLVYSVGETSDHPGPEIRVYRLVR